MTWHLMIGQNTKNSAPPEHHRLSYLLIPSRTISAVRLPSPQHRRPLLSELSTASISSTPSSDLEPPITRTRVRAILDASDSLAGQTLVVVGWVKTGRQLRAKGLFIADRRLPPRWLCHMLLAE